MTQRRQSISILLSFSELAWIVVFLLGVVFAVTAREDASATARLRDDLTTAEEGRASAVRDAEKAAKGWADEQEVTKGLRDQITSLRDQVAPLRDQVAAMDGIIDGLKQELEAQKTVAQTLADELTQARSDMERASADRDAFQREANEQRVAALREAQRAQDAEQQLAAMATQFKDALAVLGMAPSSTSATAEDAERLRERLAQLLAGETLQRQELLGIKGALDRVVFVVDRSGSMRKRWDYCQQIIRTWLEHLLVKQGALLMFASGPDAYPADRAYLELSGMDAINNRKLLLERFDAMPPNFFGGTNTYRALSEAFAYEDVQTIILFTDGRPQAGGPTSGTDDVLALCRRQREAGRRVVINTIGMGDYFELRTAEFLMRLASENGGAFIGR